MAAILALVALLACACSKEAGPFPRPGSGPGSPVEFSAYAGHDAGQAMPAVTKAVSCDPSYVLGHWVDSTSTFVPGTGIGVFAFYQKAKSNGYPSDFGKNTGEPTFMYNQKLERTTADGTEYTFEYSPKKYWPNNPNDQLSFFAYAPYRADTSWEDLRVETSLYGDRISRQYVVEDRVEDQTDLLWADPVLNRKSADATESVDFNFTHLCSRLGVSAIVNEKSRSIYVTVDKVSIKGKFTTSGTLVYLPADGSRHWEHFDGFDEAKTYVPFEARYVTDTESGTLVYNTFVVDTLKQYVHGSDGFTFVLPGTQDIEMTAVVSQRSATTDFVKSYDIVKTFPAVELKAGKAYDFLLNVTLTPVTFTGAMGASWSTGEETYTSPDNGQSWTH